MKVLIVDDEEGARKILKEIVEMWGYETCIARDGEEAIRILRNEKINVVLTDYMMPGLSGIDVARFVKLKFPETMVILISGASSRIPVDDQKLPDIILQKPIDYTLLQSLLSRRQSSKKRKSLV